MMLLLVFNPANLLQIPCSNCVGFVYKFIKCSMISGGELGLNLRANIFGVSHKSDALQDNRLKNDHPFGVPFLRSYDVELRCEG